MGSITAILKTVDDFVWGVPLIVLIMGTGIYLTVRLGILQFRKLGKAFKYMVKNEEGAEERCPASERSVPPWPPP